MSTKVIVELEIKSEKMEEVHPLFSSLLQETRSRDGNEGVTVHLDQDVPTSIILIEQWASRLQYEEYNQWRAERGDLAKLAELLQKSPQRRFLTSLVSNHRCQMGPLLAVFCRSSRQIKGQESTQSGRSGSAIFKELPISNLNSN